ncbi:MAG: FAD/NAD(P)-binding oxidoreductase [Pseudomonadota bacterium]
MFRTSCPLFKKLTPLGERVLVYDDEHYFTGGALAERFARKGHHVLYVTPESLVSSWAVMTNEQEYIQPLLLSLNVEIHLHEKITAVTDDELVTQCVYSGRDSQHQFDSLVLVTGRYPNDSLARQLSGDNALSIGDCAVPSSIADAVYAGHKFARHIGIDAAARFPKRERAQIVLEMPHV